MSVIVPHKITSERFSYPLKAAAAILVTPSSNITVLISFLRPYHPKPLWSSYAPISPDPLILSVPSAEKPNVKLSVGVSG